jgi:hypothetical protein
MKKELLIKRNDKGMFFIQYEGGGQLPDGLKGLYTKHRAAEAAVTAYKAEKSKPKREYRKSRSIENAEESKSDNTV